MDNNVALGPKQVKDIFKDYVAENSISNCYVGEINLFKKTNKLDINLNANTKVEAKDIFEFENYLIDRFKIGQINTNIIHSKEEDLSDIQDNWKNLTCYVFKKHPATIGILKNSKIEVEGNNANVTLKVKGADFLYLLPLLFFGS